MRTCIICGHDSIGVFCAKHWHMIPKAIKPKENNEEELGVYSRRAIMTWFEQIGEM